MQKEFVEDDFTPVVLGEEDIVEEEQEIEEAVQEPETEEEEEEKEPVPEPKPERKPINKKKLGIALGITAAVLAGIYFGGAAFYNSHFYFGTKINGFDCSNLTVEAAQEKVKQDISNYTYILKERGGKEEPITGEELAMQLESMGDFNEPKQNQNPFLWCMDFKSRNQNINIIVTLDEAILESKVKSLECVNETRAAMEGATSLISFQDGQFVIDDIKQAEADGYKGLELKYRVKIFPDQKFYDDPSMQKNIVSTAALITNIKDGMCALKPYLNLDESGCYVDVSEETSMKQAIDTMNKYVQTKVSYMHGDEVIPLDYGSINEWVTVDDKYNVYLDEDKVADFVHGVAQKYNTIGAKRTFVSSNGSQASVEGGDFGWRVDEKVETQKLCDIIKNGETVEREPEYSQKGYSHGSIDVGNTYVEVSINDQHLWFYKDGELIVSSDVVTGNTLAGNGTHTGIYRLKYKERNATLIGEDYRTPVSYWMPFNGGEGLHDASWRGVFGGSIYRGGGSHGCVNCPTSTAAKLFEYIRPGDPVIVY